MQVEVVSIGDLLSDPANVRKHSKKNLDSIKGSLKAFGYQKPIVVDKNGLVIAGNGTLAAAQSLGWKEIPIVRSELEGTNRTAYAIADNRTGELAEWDMSALADQLTALEELDFDLGGIGFETDDLKSLLEEKEEEEKEEEPDSPDIKFSERMGESQNYIVLLFKNDIDWLQAKDVFKICSVASSRMPGSIGTGRVVDGASFLKGFIHD